MLPVQCRVGSLSASAGWALTVDPKSSERILRAAVDFGAMSAGARERCREQYREKEGEADNVLRILVDGQVATLAVAMTVKMDSPSPATSYQIGVSTSFIRTHFIVGDLIMNGDLVEALTL